MSLLQTLSLGNLWSWLPARPAARRLSILAMLRAIETRRHLAMLDDRMLKDIGISRLDALAEAERLPWDVTPTRHSNRC